MALLTCPDCGHKVSEHAKECPNCGCPISVIKFSEDCDLDNQANEDESQENDEINDKYDKLQLGEKQNGVSNELKKDSKLITALIIAAIVIIIIGRNYSDRMYSESDSSKIVDEPEKTELTQLPDSIQVSGTALHLKWEKPYCFVTGDILLTRVLCDSLCASLLQNNYDHVKIFSTQEDKKKILYYYASNWVANKTVYYYATLEEASQAHIDRANDGKEAFDKVHVIKKHESTFDKAKSKYEKEERAREAKELEEEKNAYLKELKDLCWKDDIKVKWSGTSISFIGHHFVLNRNIEEFHDAVCPKLIRYGFKKEKYYWYEGSDCTYYSY